MPVSLCFAALLSLTACHAARAQSGTEPKPDPSPTAPDQPPPSPARLNLATLSDPQTSDQERSRIADDIVLRAARDPEAVKTLNETLDPAVPAAVRRAVLHALAQQKSIPAGAISSIAQNLGPADLPTAEAALDALAHSQDRRACGAILNAYFDRWDALPQDLQVKSIEALIAQTGNGDLGTSPDAWKVWWQTAKFLPEPEWRRQVAASQARRAAALQQQLSDATRRLVELQREIHRLTPEEQRPALLARLLRSDDPNLRSLGLQLTNRRLLNARPIDGPIITALIEALKDPVPDARASAAAILARVAPPEAHEPVLEALAAESNPAAAAALIRAATADPSPRLESIALQWLDSPDPSSSAAMDALLALMDTGRQLSTHTAAQAKDFLTRRVLALGPSGLRLLVRLGGTNNVAALLGDPSDEGAVRAARALADDADAVDLLVEAARARAAVAPAALDALAHHRPDAGGFALALELADAEDADAVRTVEGIARQIPATDVLKVAQSARDPKRVIAATQVITEDGYLTTPESPIARVDLAIIRTDALLALNRPADAISILDQLPPTWDGPRIQLLRIRALLKQDNLDQAASVTTDAIAAVNRAKPFIDIWQSAIRSADSPESARQLAAAALSHFGVHLTPSQRSQLQRLLSAPVNAAPPSAQPAPVNQEGNQPAAL